MAELTAPGLRDAYGWAAAAWESGPARMYDRLAETLVATCPRRLVGRRVLDLGAGTGAVSRLAMASGASAIAVDAAHGMLAQDRCDRPPAFVGDAAALPFRKRSFDVVVGAFVLNHLPDPVRALTEAGRVTRAGGWVLASTFHSGWDHPAKEQVETVAACYGYRRPRWYDGLKSDLAPMLGDVPTFAAAAEQAGLADVEVVERVVDVGVRAPAELVAWRLGTAHLAPFVAGLPTRTRARLVKEAVAAVGPEPEPLRPAILLCRGRGRRSPWFEKASPS